jgi:hypothetical protein
MTMIRGQLKRKMGREDVGVPPPVPQADYYTVMDSNSAGGNGWDSDEFESSDEYEDPPDEESFEVPGKMMMFAYIHLYLRKALCTYLLGIDL